MKVIQQSFSRSKKLDTISLFPLSIFEAFSREKCKKDILKLNIQPKVCMKNLWCTQNDPIKMKMKLSKGEQRSKMKAGLPLICHL